MCIAHMLTLGIWLVLMALQCQGQEASIAQAVALDLDHDDPVSRALMLACEGDLDASALEVEHYIDGSAAGMHMRSALAMIREGALSIATALHKQAKALDPSLTPPLAALFLQGRDCSGLGDLFYVSAVLLKRLVDASVDSLRDTAIEAHCTLLTLTADSGYNAYAEQHVQRCLALESSDAACLFRSMLMTPAVFSSIDELHATRGILEGRLEQAMNNVREGRGPLLSELNEFSLASTFYLAYQGYDDRPFLETLHTLYIAAFPTIAQHQPAPALIAKSGSQRLVVGFVSSYFRRHSICKLYCGVILGLDPSRFEVVVFSATANEDSYTAKLQASTKYVRIGKPLIQNRSLVAGHGVQVLVYLDIGMDPAMKIWATARLAPIQVCLWGHPSTTGLPSVDLYISADGFHQHRESRRGFAIANRASLASPVLWTQLANSTSASSAQNAFTEQLVRFDSLGVHFKRATLASFADDDLVKRSGDYYARLIGTLSTEHGPLAELIRARGAELCRLVLCPQHLPKFHPAFDAVLRDVLGADATLRLVLVYQEKKNRWRTLLTQRWAKSLGMHALSQVVWLPTLSPTDYLALLAAGDVMIDPFPFGGGVTSLEALSVCTPVLTLPALQTVPGLTAGMYLSLPPAIGEALIASHIDDYVEKALNLLQNPSNALNLRRLLCGSVDALFEQQQSVSEWERFLQRLVV